MDSYPLKFKPIYKKRIWGGQKLREIFNKNIPPLEKIGESWELADLPEDKSVIANGELAGQTLNSAIQKYPKEITGFQNFSGTFPLLIKFLDAEDILSVQVHPDSKTCQRIGKGSPKTECWYIVSAVPDAVIYKGLKKGVTKRQFSKAIKEGSVAELLAKVPVEAGQCHFLPAGTAHSIGAGLLIAEIQTPSDTTYRVFDWNRVDETGKPRQLHIEEALESINFNAAGSNLLITTVGRLVDCEFFTIDKGHQAEGCELLLSPDRMKTLIILTGSGAILAPDETSVKFSAGDCLLVPAVYEGAVQFADDTQYLIVSLRERNEQ
ncbi:MAG: class I mannose-6-phosphate isomerase [Sedimentisphaerales bacterium]|nr:class I mannose-6-phosphate isomerase [Sedimentisphaerales bacterium]